MFGTLRPYFRKVYFAKFEGVCSTDITVLRSKNSQKTHPRFFFYFIANKPFIDYATSTSNGTRMPRAKWKNLIKKPFWVPDYETQHKIASILSAYDDLIENNLRRIKLLEEAARLIYKEWFVRLRFPGHEHIRVVDGVPEGWARRVVKEILEISIGGGWGKDDNQGDFTEPAYVIRGTDIPDINQGNINRVPFRYHKESNLKSREMKARDIILEVSNGQIDNVGRTFMLYVKLLELFREPVICASFCKLLRVNKNVAPELLYLHIKEIQNNGHLNFYKNPSAAGINNFRFKDFIENELLLIPNNQLYCKFIGTIRPIFDQVSIISTQSYKLSQARDILLPRLMNGSIQV